jgi:hypothetical protein
VLSSGATASIAYCTVPDFSTIDDVGIRWFITGSNGELETTAPRAQWQMGSPDITLRAKLRKGSEVETTEFKDDGDVEEVREREFPGGNTARVWQAWVKGRGERIVDFGGGLELHRVVGFDFGSGK